MSSGEVGQGRASRRPAIPALTSLRFVAALYVVLFHLSPVTTYPFPLNRIIDQGRAGVAFFFILSGFILTYNYADWFRADLSRSWRFYQARIARVYPMYVVGLAICTPLTLYFLYTSNRFASRWYNGNVVPADIGLSWLVNLIAVQPFVPVQAFQYYWNSPGWSIGAEFFFYALFPLAVRIITRRFGTPRRLLTLLIAVGAIQVSAWLALTLWIASTFRGQAYHDAMDLFVYKPPIMRLPEFLIGCILGALVLQMIERPATHPLGRLMTSSAWRNAAVAAALIGCLIVVFLPTPEPTVLIVYPMKFFVLFTPVFSLLILAVASGHTVLHSVLERRWALLLGEASFSVYILHGSVRMVLVDVAGTASLPLGVVVLTVIGVIGLSLMCYAYVEGPAREAVRDRLSQLRFRARRTLTVASTSE